MTGWVEIGDAESVPRLGSRIVRTKAGNVAIFRTDADEFFALRDRCPHKGGPLSQGIVHGRRVTCPLHNFVVELDTGKVVAPDEGCTRTHAVRVQDGQLWLAVGASSATSTPG
jgi:nitrite reductase (NADH) small subunit